MACLARPVKTEVPVSIAIPHELLVKLIKSVVPHLADDGSRKEGKKAPRKFSYAVFETVLLS
jgi:hypothetical protein